MFQKLRHLVSEKVTERANEVLPEAVADKWKNTNFEVLFPGTLHFEQPCNYDDDNWTGWANLEGECVVRILTDENSPVDPTPLIASLFKQPIVINPSEDEFIKGFMVFALTWKATGMKDLLAQPVITVITGPIRSGYMLERKEVADVFLPSEPEELTVTFNEH